MVNIEARVIIVYDSSGGNTQSLAEGIARGAKRLLEVETDIRSVDEIQASEILDADGYAFGSPTYFNYMSGKIKTKNYTHTGIAWSANRRSRSPPAPEDRATAQAPSRTYSPTSTSA